MRNYKKDYTTLAINIAAALCKATEYKIKEYFEQNKPKNELQESLLTNAERNSYKAEELRSNYSSEEAKRDLDLH